MMNKSSVIKQLMVYGLTAAEAGVYLTLLKKGVLTPLELSRLTDINRTTLYRLLEKLQKIGLVEEILAPKSTSFRAAEPARLKLLLAKKEAEVAALRRQMANLVKELTTAGKSIAGPTRVVYFRGINGLQQLLWNTLKAKVEVLGFGYLDWNEAVGRRFAERLRREYVERQIYSREIDNHISSKVVEFTAVKGYDKIYQERELPESKLPIHHDTYIYNDVFAFCHFFQGELFGVEIHNAEIAQTQKKIFEILWKMAKK